ncbi:hypothetical protein [Laceyella sacchari]|uniref:Uncharacterized protein n=1 Tax=Laceyella sacchari TaxID=37482 RepID=A0ABY5U0K9_LACSH|nr:hypothetical protein [Laceyella sacchari]UWE03201.1 hypothetical protein NYR52_13945 [Laceyella sacchari]
MSGKEKRGKGSKVKKVVFGTDEDVTDARVRPLEDRIVHSGLRSLLDKLKPCYPLPLYGIFKQLFCGCIIMFKFIYVKLLVLIIDIKKNHTQVMLGHEYQ